MIAVSPISLLLLLAAAGMSFAFVCQSCLYTVSDAVSWCLAVGRSVGRSGGAPRVAAGRMEPAGARAPLLPVTPRGQVVKPRGGGDENVNPTRRQGRENGLPAGAVAA